MRHVQTGCAQLSAYIARKRTLLEHAYPQSQCMIAYQKQNMTINLADALFHILNSFKAQPLFSTYEPNQG